MNIRRAIMGLLVSGLFISTTIAKAQASATDPFKTLRVVVENDTAPTVFVGGAPSGQTLTVTNGTPGHYHVDFPPGTWSSCFFVPQVQTLFTSATAEITGYGTRGDGSGGIDVVVSSGANAWLVMVFTSANC